MMSENEVLQYYNVKRPSLINNNTFVSNNANFGRAYIVMLYNRIAGVCLFNETAKAITENIINTEVIYSFSRGGGPSDQEINIEKSKSWFYRRGKYYRWFLTFDFLSKEQVDDLIILNQKIAYIDRLNTYVSNYRRSTMSSINLQDHVYNFKYEEAKDIIKNEVEVDDVLKYPFVTAYSEFADISLQEAAKRVIFYQESNRAYLAESEAFRLKYTKMFINSNTIEEMESISKDFNVEYNKYGAL